MKGVIRMADFIIAGIIILLVGAAIAYIIKEKKRGAVCIGCSNSGCVHKNSGCGGSCGGCHSEEK